jgi:ectoine hydroxylase
LFRHAKKTVPAAPEFKVIYQAREPVFVTMQLTAQQIESFEQDGYLFFPNAFSAEETRVLKQAALDVYALQREEVWREKTGVARTAFAAHTYNDAFRRLGAHPRLIEPVMQLLDGPVYMHQCKVNAKAAFDGDVWQWHQDYGTWARDDLMPEPRAMNVAVFLDDVTAANGPLLFIPGSHKQGVVDAGHDLETTSYRTHRRRRFDADVFEPVGACQSGQHQPDGPYHRVSVPVPRG